MTELLLAPDRTQTRPEFQTCFGVGSQPTADPSNYPEPAEVLGYMRDRRMQLLQVLEALDDEELSKSLPKGAPDFLSDAASVFESLKEGLGAPLGGMGIAFSSSLFGLSGSLVLGFLDLQTSQAQNRFYTDLEDWLSTTVRDLGSEGEPRSAPSPIANELRLLVERLKEGAADSGASKAATNAMANLAEAIQGLVGHMRSEQQMIRDWVNAQADQQQEIRRLLERLAREEAPPRIGRGM